MNKAKEELYSGIDNIPPNGEWWKQDTRVTFRRAGQKMLEAGMKVENIVGLLGSLYWAVASEYGG